MRKLIISVAAAAALLVPMLPTAASAQPYGYYGSGYRYGGHDGDVRRERRECRRELRRAESRREYRRELRECRREIARARRGWHDDDWRRDSWRDHRRGYWRDRDHNRDGYYGW
jgi:hypothetical protein